MVADDRINIAALREALELGIVDDVMRETPRVLDLLIQEKREHRISAINLNARLVMAEATITSMEARLAEAERVMAKRHRFTDGTLIHRTEEYPDHPCDICNFLAGGEEE